MNRKGFSLVELIGVLVLLSIIILIAVPAILGAMENTSDKMDKATEEMLLANARSYVNDIKGENGASGNIYCIKVQTLVEENYTKEPIGNMKEEESKEFIRTKSVEFKFSKISNNATGDSEWIVKIIDNRDGCE